MTRKSPNAPLLARRSLPGMPWRMIGGIVLLVSTLVTGLSWVIASPLGSSPDDDYHLGSIWCPHPVEESGCEVGFVEGEKRIYVPQTVAANSPCYAFQKEKSAACRNKLSDDKYSYSNRFDDGAYPKGYYHFHHLFVDSNVNSAAITMRVINLLFALVPLALIAFFMPRKLTPAFGLAILTAWMPMGLYFVTSNNPSSWSISGIMIYASGMLASLKSERWRRWVLMAIAVVGALMAMTSRGDAAFFIFVVSLALVFHATWQRSSLIHLAVATPLSIAGIITTTSVGQSNALASSPAPSLPLKHLILSNVRTLPEYLAGMWGYYWGPGWLDVPFEGAVLSLGLLVAGAAFLVGAKRITWRKGLASLTVFGAICGIPVVLAVKLGYVRLWEFQPRYMMPLLAVFFLLWLYGSQESRLLSATQMMWIGFLSILLNLLALHTLLARYTHGMGNFSLNLNANPQWWWNLPFGPMHVWLVGALAYTVTVVTALMLIHHFSSGGKVSSAKAD